MQIVTGPSLIAHCTKRPVNEWLLLITPPADFFIYNNYKNHIINNKSDKIKILNL
jgi:hypothetical protein